MTTSFSSLREPVAIIGMGCRLPGNIDHPELLWKTLTEGRDCITHIPQQRWEHMMQHLHPDQIPAQPFAAGVVDHNFDHAFFGITADEAAEMDPQQGWLLEVGHEALADASLTPASLSGTHTGVYVGAASIDQAAVNFAPGARAGVFTSSGAGMSLLANRLSHHLDLSGPSLSLDTACSSSLTALHYAVRDLRSGEVDLALVAGTNVLTNPVITASFVEAGVLTPKGRCTPFDHQAQGYVRSEGAVVLVLTRARLAAERGHRVWAHIAGTGIGHGGKAPHLLAPRADRQAHTIRRALADAGLRAGQVGWVQAHGTGTRAGDRIEARGIAHALNRGVPVPVGSVKSTLGHLEGAAGTVGVMVAALAVHHGQIPPTLHHQHLRAGLEEHIRVPTTVEAWPSGEHAEQEETRVAGVSSFGFGGSNAHALLTPAPAVEPPPSQDPMPLPETVLLSARSTAGLSQVAERLAEQAPGAGSVAALAHTALARGAHHPCRAAITAPDLGSLIQGLRAVQDGQPHPQVIGPTLAPDQRPRVVFVYSGHGGHHPAAGSELMRLPVFAHAVEEARTALGRQTGYQVWAPGEPITGFADAQHCTFLTQVGLTALLTDRSVFPDVVLGHSVGEIAAAHTAGTLGLDSASRVLAERSRLLSGLTDAGGLLAIRAGVEETNLFLAPYEGRVSIASYSAPQVQVVAGPRKDLVYLQARLTTQEVWCTQVSDVIPAHSPAVDTVAPALGQALAGLVPRPAQVSIISTAFPRQGMGTARFGGSTYWSEQARQPVRLTEALRTAATTLEGTSEGGPVVFIEIGPRALLVEHITHTLPENASLAVTGAPDGPARGIAELYTRGLVPTGPTDRAHPHLIIRPGWDHTGRPDPADDDGPLPTPAPDQVQAHLSSEIARLVSLPEGLDMESTWYEAGLASHGLLQLTSRLRRVHPWAQVDIQLFLPTRTWGQVVADLRSLLTQAPIPRAQVLHLR